MKRRNGTGSVWLRKDGRYCASVVEKGKRYYGYGSTPEIAVRKLAGRGPRQNTHPHEWRCVCGALF